MDNTEAGQVEAGARDVATLTAARPMKISLRSPGTALEGVSFVLVNFNMGGLVRRVVEQISGGLGKNANFEMIVGDNSTEPAQRLAADSFSPDQHVRLIALEENRGFVDALNRVLPLCGNPWIIVMHPDVEIGAADIRSLAEFLKSHPRAGVVSPDLYYPNGVPCRIRLRLPAVGTEVRRLCNMLTHIVVKRKFLRDEIFWDRRGAEADVAAETVMSVCMMFRKAALQAAGPVDPGLTFYYANDYLCHRLARAGYTCHYTRDAKAVHFERYTPTELYSDSDVMRYKASPIAANPRMRRDYFCFLRLCYPLWRRGILRALALGEDVIQLVAQGRHPRARRAEIGQLWKSILADLGISRR